MFLFLDGYNCFVSGIGEVLKRVKRKKKYYLLFLPNISCSTKKVFEAFKFNNFSHSRNLKNELKFAIFDCYPELRKIYSKINKTISVNFSGTGSTFFAEFENYGEAELCKNSIKVGIPCIITRVWSQPSTFTNKTNGEWPSWLRQRILIPSCVGSNPTSPAINHMSYDSLTIFTGNANLKLASSVAKHLNYPWVKQMLEDSVMVKSWSNFLKMLEEKMRLFFSRLYSYD